MHSEQTSRNFAHRRVAAAVATLGAPTLHQKRTQVRFWFPARIPAPYEPPWSELSENIKITEGCIFIVVHKVKSKYSAVEARNIFYEFLELLPFQ